METPGYCPDQNKDADTEWAGVGRALGGAILFTLPLMLTMEIWWLGYRIEPWRLLCILLVSFPVFIKISTVIGFTESRKLLDNVVDVFVAYAFGFLISTLAISLFGVSDPDDSFTVKVMTATLIAIPASLGALLGRSELGSGEHDNKREQSRSDIMAVLAVGSLYLGFNIAATDEVIQISHQMTVWQLLILFILTVVIMHVFSGCCTQTPNLQDATAREVILGQLSYTGMAVLVAFSITLFLLWGFGQTDGQSLFGIVSSVVIVLLPAGVGAAAADYII